MIPALANIVGWYCMIRLVMEIPKHPDGTARNWAVVLAVIGCAIIGWNLVEITLAGVSNAGVSGLTR